MHPTEGIGNDGWEDTEVLSAIAANTLETQSFAVASGPCTSDLELEHMVREGVDGNHRPTERYDFAADNWRLDVLTPEGESACVIPVRPPKLKRCL